MKSKMSFNDSDFESPGYEFLRTYHSMSNLYHKLISLNFHKEFCSIYKCPPIHRYYFSMPCKNLSEQQFIFTCLCAWLIKDKCKMNLELEPDEYDDIDSTVGVIMEAVKLLISDEDVRDKRSAKNFISFPSSRLKQGFGPEIVWTLNLLADRATELLLEDVSQRDGKIKLTFVSDSSSDPARQRDSTSIVIGKPYVGGGLTTRPLGNYQVNDASLLFDDDQQEESSRLELVGANELTIDPDEWYRQVERAIPVLQSVDLKSKEGSLTGWRDLLQRLSVSREAIREFQDNSRALQVISDKISSQLKEIDAREKQVQANLSDRLGNFLKIFRNYTDEKCRNEHLNGVINQKTDQFDSLNDQLKEINAQIEARIVDLNDGGRLRELESKTELLETETRDYELKIRLLLTMYGKKPDWHDEKGTPT